VREMKKILIEEETVDRKQNAIYYQSGVYETRFDNVKRLFEFCQQEFGRCTSKVYIDVKGKAMAIGWVFEKTEHYTDTKEPFKAESWITLHRREPKRTVKHFYRKI